MWYISTVDYYSAKKKKKKDEIMSSAATRIRLEMIILSEISQKDKYHRTLLICQM